MARISPTQIKASRLLAPVLAISVLAGCVGLRRDAEADLAAPAKAGDARIRLAVLNAGFLPGPLGSRNVERAERIADRLLVEPGPDVIVLLEVFDERARRALVRRFAPSHPWIVARADAGLVLREDSGLFVASRIPFEGISSWLR